MFSTTTKQLNEQHFTNPPEDGDLLIKTFIKELNGLVTFDSNHYKWIGRTN